MTITWLILGAVIAIGLYFAATKLSLTWYEWILAGLGLILILFSIQNYVAYGVELESRAQGMFLLVFGLPGLVLAVIGFVLPYLRMSKMSKAG
jgi:uncharacterized membrane protein